MFNKQINTLSGWVLSPGGTSTNYSTVGCMTNLLKIPPTGMLDASKSHEKISETPQKSFF
jgi:hypothetical protein